MAYKIILQQTRIIINDYTPGDSPRLEKYFTLYDPITHMRYIKGIIYKEDTRQLILPRGLDIYLLEEIFSAIAHTDMTHDAYDTTDPIMLKKLPRDDNQCKTLRFILGEGEYHRNKYKSQLCVNNSTGSGKTYVASATIAYTLWKSIVISSTNGVINQWVERLQEYTDITPKDICIIKGQGVIHRLLKADNSKYKIYLVTHSTLNDYAGNNGWDAVGDLFRSLKIGLKIYDEYHYNFDNMIYIDGHTNTYKTLYLSATPARSSEGENNIFQYCFKNVPNIDTFDPDKDPHTDYLALIYSSEPTPYEISACKNQYGLDRNRYTSYVLKKENFQLLMHYLINKIMYISGKTLIYIGTNSAITFVKDWITENYPELRTKVGVFTSITPPEEKREQLDKKIILSTTKSCGAAIDIYGLKVGIILDEPFKSEILAVQAMGRLRAEDTRFIECVDRGFRPCFAYYQHKREAIEKHARSMHEVRMNSYELREAVGRMLEERSKRKNPFIYLNPGERIAPFMREEDTKWTDCLVKE